MEYRFTIFDVGDRSGILVLLSHLVSDAWTFGLMANQLDQAYRKLAGEDGISLVCGDYTDYIHTEDAYLAKINPDNSLTSQLDVCFRPVFPAPPTVNPLVLLTLAKV